MLRSAFKDEAIRSKFLIPTLHFRFFERVLFKELSSFMKEKFGITKTKSVAAIKKADLIQTDFEYRIKKRGEEVMRSLPKGKRALI